MSQVTRRSFLHTTALAGAGTLVGTASCRSRAKVHDVAVIGAGMAGMAAMRDLVRAGLDVVLLEAQDRVGGRMESLGEPAPHGLEVGAQMIHGSRAPTWELIREFGIDTRPLGPWAQHAWEPDKGFREIDPARVKAAQARLHEAYMKYRGEDITFQKFLDDLRFSPEDQALVSGNALSWSAEPDEVSLRASMEDSASWDVYVDENYQVVGGYAGLAARLVADLGDYIRLSSLVDNIAWGRRGIKIDYERSGKREQVRARRAVVTLPIGVLQAGRPVFSPVLPAWKQKAINSLRMGRVVIFLLLFDDWFWRQLAPGVPGWSMSGGRISFSDPHPVGSGEPALSGWVTGTPAQELSDLGREAAMRRVLSWLEAALPGAGARKRLEWSYLRDWVRDPFSQGSYSFTLPGGMGQRRVLATPLLDCLHFAGEATAPAPHYQTVHGAYSSGRRAAREILSALGVELKASLGGATAAPSRA